MDFDSGVLDFLVVLLVGGGWIFLYTFISRTKSVEIAFTNDIEDLKSSHNNFVEEESDRRHKLILKLLDNIFENNTDGFSEQNGPYTSCCCGASERLQDLKKKVRQDVLETYPEPEGKVEDLS